MLNVLKWAIRLFVMAALLALCVALFWSGIGIP